MTFYLFPFPVDTPTYLLYSTFIMSTTEKCFACDRRLGKNPGQAGTRDDQIVYVGNDCLKRIVEAGEQGYQPPKGGPRLYVLSKH